MHKVLVHLSLFNRVNSTDGPSSISLGSTAFQNTGFVPTQADCDALREPMFCGLIDESSPSTYQFAICPIGGNDSLSYSKFTAIELALPGATRRGREWSDRRYVMEYFSDVSNLHPLIVAEYRPLSSLTLGSP